MSSSSLETFRALDEAEIFSHCLTLRHPEIDAATDKDGALARLGSHYAECISSLGFRVADLVTGEQVHGDEVAVVEGRSGGVLEGVDGLVSQSEEVLLGVYVADCCAVYIVDRVGGGFGLVHSGKEGTRLGIVGKAIRRMESEFGVEPAGLRVQLSPCIRPPHYEIDFAAEIRRQCEECGVLREEIFDEGVSTATDLERYYSYRMEKGLTGRMLALLGRRR